MDGANVLRRGGHRADRGVSRATGRASRLRQRRCIMKASTWTKRLIEQAGAAVAKREKIELRPAPPTYSALNSVLVEDAREEFDRVFDAYLVAAEAWNGAYAQDEEQNDEQSDDAPLEGFAEHAVEAPNAPPAPVHDARESTGVGNTPRAAAR